MRISRTRLLSRETNVRDARLCIIATEGREAEKDYFAMFGDSRVHVLVLTTDSQSSSAPQHVLDRLKLFQVQYDLGEQDNLWLMIDVDRWHGLQHVCKEAKQIGVKLAVSNPCFELWLLLHHADVDPSDTKCKAVENRLRGKLGGYNKTNLQRHQFHPHVYEAVERAKQLDNSPAEIWPAFPGTHVYKVIESLPFRYGPSV